MQIVILVEVAELDNPLSVARQLARRPKALLDSLDLLQGGVRRDRSRGDGFVAMHGRLTGPLCPHSSSANADRRVLLCQGLARCRLGTHARIGPDWIRPRLRRRSRSLDSESCCSRCKRCWCLRCWIPETGTWEPKDCRRGARKDCRPKRFAD